MKTSTLILVGAITAAAAGCVPKSVTLDEKARHNATLVRIHNIDADEAAVLRQGTLYPYHFEPASARLNELGQRDAMILARRCREAPGDAPACVNVRRGDSSETLYRARMRTVTALFASAGVSAGTVVEDQLPGGDGMSAERVLTVKDRVPERGSDRDSMGVGSSGSSIGSR